jgi:hypothetical protein
VDRNGARGGVEVADVLALLVLLVGLARVRREGGTSPPVSPRCPESVGVAVSPTTALKRQGSGRKLSVTSAQGEAAVPRKASAPSVLEVCSLSAPLALSASAPPPSSTSSAAKGSSGVETATPQPTPLPALLHLAAPPSRAPSGVRVPFAVWDFGGCGACCVPSETEAEAFCFVNFDFGSEDVSTGRDEADGRKRKREVGVCFQGGRCFAFRGGIDLLIVF